jgi:hypothetical protein
VTLTLTGTVEAATKLGHHDHEGDASKDYDSLRRCRRGIANGAQMEMAGKGEVKVEIRN